MLRYCLSIITILLFVHTKTFADSLPFAGWEYISEKLKQDGVDEQLLHQVYDGVLVPQFDMVPFKLKPVESHAMYKGFLAKKSIEKGKFCKKVFARQLEEVEKLFDVDPSVVISLLYVETRCGKNVGKEAVVNRLSRVASVKDPKNLQKFYEILHNEDPTITYEDLEERATYLEETFYPHLLALYILHAEGALSLFSLKGSTAGAFGWPQFLPLTVYRYGIDGDNNGRIDLFTPNDAILSIGHFLAAHGWKAGMSEEEKRAIIWQYNKSEPYIDAVLELSKVL